MKSLIENQINEWTSKNLGSHFKFRENQFGQITNIIYNVVNNDPNKTQLIEAPTGSGKSIIILVSAGVLADYYDLKSYVLCSDLYLFSQYENFIKENNLNMGYCKGITNNYICPTYKCMLNDAPCKASKTPYRNLRIFGGNQYECSLKCKYMKERKKAIYSKVSVITYALFMFQMNICGGGLYPDNELTRIQNYSYSENFYRRPIIFCDECHKIPNLVQLYISPYICPTRDYPIYHEILNYVFKNSKKFNEEEYFKLLKEKYELLRNETNPYEVYYHYKGYVGLLKTISTCTDIINKILYNKPYDEMSPYDKFIFSKVNHFNNLMCYLNDFVDAIEHTSPLYLVKKCDSNGITFNCVLESKLVQNYLFKHSDYQILTSATVGNKNIFDENCGIEHSSINRIPSNFKFKNSPIIYMSGLKMSQNKIKNSMSDQLINIMNILDKHKDERGIIHTASYALAKKLYKLLPEEYKERIIIYNASSQKELCIKNYKKYHNKVLIGPSIVEGVDLPDDMCRFNVILKIPFPSMGDPYVYRKMRLYTKWYNAHTSNCVIQALGRGIRHKNDECISYILDGCFTRLRKLTKDQYPIEFTSRLIEIDHKEFNKLFSKKNEINNDNKEVA